jgi:DivIVA domain-containing protein
VKLSPLDIRHMEFERGPMGFKTRQVGDFLERVALEVESLLSDLQAMRRQVDAQKSEIEALRETEAELKRAVVSAERVGNQIVEQARKEADLILRTARHDRLELLRAADHDLEAARAEVVRLEHAQALVREQLRGQLTAFLAALDTKPRRRARNAADARGDDLIAALKAAVAAAQRDVEASAQGAGLQPEAPPTAPEPRGPDQGSSDVRITSEEFDDASPPSST